MNNKQTNLIEPQAVGNPTVGAFPAAPKPTGPASGSGLVAVLCAATNSVYHQMPGVEVYDIKRDARTFPGGMPLVAHPPCRAWSAHCAHQAKPEPGEKELGLWCVKQVKQWGGIPEQPAHSRLWDAAELPKPGWATDGTLWATEVWQNCWGYPMRKATWLLFSKISPLFVLYPFRLHPQGNDRRTEQLMSKNQRSATTPAFAEWLVHHARYVGRPASEWDGQNTQAHDAR